MTALIGKFLVVGKQLFYTTSKTAYDHDDSVRVVELSLPIETYWESCDILKELEYMIVSSEETIDIKEKYKKFFKRIAPYAIVEKDRIWLYEKTK